MDNKFFKFTKPYIMKTQEELIWWEGRKVGYVDVHERQYDESYFNKYIEYSQTAMGYNINNFRLEFVERFVKGKVLDIGIGCGSFIDRYGNAEGFDINPKAIDLLASNKKFFDLDLPGKSLDEFGAVTFFDSFEHIRNHSKILDRITVQYVIMSIPTFKDMDHALNSKHFRPTEHYYYFTRASMEEYMEFNGFKLKGVGDGEIKAGREDIMTFAFRRK